MIYHRANIGHLNCALTASTVILVLSILYSGDPIAFAQGPRQVGLNQPIAFAQGPRQVGLNQPIAFAQGPRESSGHFRCTDGSLVGQCSECPSDQCPASTSNHVVQCTPHTFRPNQVNDRMVHFPHCANKENLTSYHFYGCHEFRPIKEHYTQKVLNTYFQYNPSS